MPDDPSQFDTGDMHDLLGRMKGGQPDARDELVRATRGRLELLVRKMLGRFPNVRRWADEDDVYQQAVMRLLAALKGVSPNDTRGFFNLAAAMIRRELLDLARKYAGPEGVGANHASVGSVAPERAAPDPAAADLERWAAFHQAVEGLPVEEREAFGLAFYHGWTQPRIAELFAVDERTVRRRWRAACQRLSDALGGELPEM